MQRVTLTSYYTKDQLQRLLREVAMLEEVLDIETLEIIDLPVIRDFSYMASDVSKGKTKNIIISQQKESTKNKETEELFTTTSKRDRPGYVGSKKKWYIIGGSFFSVMVLVAIIIVIIHFTHH